MFILLEPIQAPIYDSNTLQNTSFVGGVSKDGVGVTTMALDVDYVPKANQNSNGGNLKAKKTWFSFGDQIVALGAGISSTFSEGVSTTLNQTLLKGDVTLGDMGTLPKGTMRLISGVTWVHHDDVGYIFLDNFDRYAAIRFSTGDWSRISQHGAGHIVSDNVFALMSYHGNQPVDHTYQYIILPNKTVEQVSEYYQNMPLRVIRNSKDVQAVLDTQHNVIGAVFFEAGELVVSDSYKVSVDRPSVVILDNSGSELTVALSTPGAGGAVNLTVQVGTETYRREVITSSQPELLGMSVNVNLGESDLVTDAPESTLVPKQSFF